MTSQGGMPERRVHLATDRDIPRYREILIDEIIQGLGELRRRADGLLVSGFSAGLDIGFSVLLMATAITVADGEFSPAIMRVVLASLYAVGFIFVVVGRSELFTEHTALAVFPVLAGRASLGSLARLWTLIFVANVAGALVFSAILAVLGTRLGIIEESAFLEIAAPLIGHVWWVTVLSAVLAGWLMGLLSWLVTAARETLGQIVVVWLVTASIGFAQLHHSIVGTVEVATPMFAGLDVGVQDLGRFLALTTLGNSIGGAVFVALIKYAHAARSGPSEAGESEDLRDEAAAAGAADAASGD